jgi:hypothetical protein
MESAEGMDDDAVPGGEDIPPHSGVSGAARSTRSALILAASGAAFAVLFVASMVTLSRTPGPRASDAAIAAFYAGDDRQPLVLAGLYLLPLSAVAFLWFVAILRDWESNSARRLSRVLSNVQLLSGIGFITLSLASAAASTVAAFMVEFAGVALEPAVARQFPLYGAALLYVFAMRMAAIFVTSTIGIVRVTGIFPLWFVAASYVVAAVLFLAATLNVWLVLVFPAWVLLLSAIIAVRAHAIVPTSRQAP